jgi:hypothetical protein
MTMARIDRALTPDEVRALQKPAVQRRARDIGIDVMILSRGLPDGVHYAGTQLAPWMTPEEHKEHRDLWFLASVRGLAASERRRLVELRRRRAGQSVVARWEIIGDVPHGPQTLQNGLSNGIDDTLLGGGYASDSSNRYLDCTARLFELAPEWLLSQRTIAQAIARKDLLDAAERVRAVGLVPEAVIARGP